MPTYWSDVSQYNQAVLNDSYPHPFFSFRTNSGNARDALAMDNARAAKRMLDSGKLKGVFAYYFFRPGQANCDLHVQMLKDAGLWGHPLLATMVDVEDAGGQIRGDHSAEVNNEIARLRKWYGDDRRVFGYLNGVANEGLWRTRPAGLKFVTPSYSGRPGMWATPNPPAWLQNAAFGHQFTDSAVTKPWPLGTDLNYSSLSVEEIQALLGLKKGGTAVGAVEDGAGQLSGRFGNVRRMVNPDSVKYLPKSFNPKTDPNGPAANDMWAAIVNEVVWDGYAPDKFVGDEDSNEPRALVGLVLLGLARQKRIEAKLDKLLGGTA
ncbi:lysin A, glycosyl hydrolase domain [Gordonia phage SweatNTears]|nr:lysin A, glycosyl hydrolase domain [Gordonia phage SweatNTears]